MPDCLRVHLVWPPGSDASGLDSVGREIGQRLEASYDVVYHDWESPGPIRHGAADVLLGRPHPARGTCFRASVKASDWHRKILLCPFSQDVAEDGFLDRVMPDVDAFLAVTPLFWFISIEQSPFAHWRPRMVHVDMAIDPVHYPPIKTSFGPAGSRGIVYVGDSNNRDHVAYLSELAQRVPSVRFGWIGGGQHPILGFEHLGHVDTSTRDAQRALAEFDCLICVGRNEASSVAVLEAMGLGLIPVSTPLSGYYHNPGIINISESDLGSASRVIRALNQVNDAWLRRIQEHNHSQIASHFNWDRLSAQVVAEIESTGTRPLGHESIRDRTLLRCGELKSSRPMQHSTESLS